MGLLDLRKYSKKKLECKGQLDIFGQFGKRDHLVHLVKCEHFQSVSTILKTKRARCCMTYINVHSLVRKIILTS